MLKDRAALPLVINEALKDTDGEGVEVTGGDTLPLTMRDGDAIEAEPRRLALPEPLGETVAVGDTLGALDLDDDLLGGIVTLLLAPSDELEDNDPDTLGRCDNVALVHALRVQPQADNDGRRDEEDEPPNEGVPDVVGEPHGDADKDVRGEREADDDPLVLRL